MSKEERKKGTKKKEEKVSPSNSSPKEEMIKKFLADKSNDFECAFEDIYSSIEECIGIGGVCLYTYKDLLGELPYNKLNCLDLILKFLTKFYTINLIDMTGTTALHESGEEYIISEDCGLTYQFISKE